MNVELDSIVQYDRLSGDPGEIAAVNYLVRTLEDEGIQVRVDTFLAFISDPVSAKVEVPGTDFAPEAITVSGSGDVRNLERPLVDLGNLGDLPPFLLGTGERLVLEAQGPRGSRRFPTSPNLQGRIAVVTGQPRPGPVAQLAQMGAEGVVFINPEERLNDLTTTTVWGTPSLRSYHRIPTLPVAEIKRSDGDRLRAMMAEGTVELSHEHRDPDRVEATSPGGGHHSRTDRRCPLRPCRGPPGFLVPWRNGQRGRQRGHAGVGPGFFPTSGPAVEGAGDRLVARP